MAVSHSMLFFVLFFGMYRLDLFPHTGEHTFVISINYKSTCDTYTLHVSLPKNCHFVHIYELCFK